MKWENSDVPRFLDKVTALFHLKIKNISQTLFQKVKQITKPVYWTTYCIVLGVDRVNLTPESIHISLYIYIYIYIYIWNYERKSKTSRKIYIKTKYQIFLQWNTKFFFSESSVSSAFWILRKLHELCESCRRNSLESL